MNTLSSLLTLCCVCGLSAAFLWGAPSTTRRDCQWIAWRTTGRCEEHGTNVYRITKVRDKIPARNGGMDCAGSDTEYDDCNETEYVASTLLDTISTRTSGDSSGSIDTSSIFVAPPFKPGVASFKPQPFNPCTRPHTDAAGNPTILGKPCETRKRRRRSADGNVEVYEEPLKERSRVKRQATLSLKHRDILFLIDESGSVGSLNFKKEVRLAKAIIGNWCGGISVGKQRTRVGILGFDTEQHPMLDFNQLFEASRILNHMDTEVTYTSSSAGSTCLYDALEFTGKSMMSPARGARVYDRNAEQVVVLITDGCANCKNQGDLPTLLKDVRIRFERKKIPIITFFIGNLSPSCKTIMEGLADGALCYQLFTAANWIELDAMSAHIEGRECMDSWQIGKSCPQQ